MKKLIVIFLCFGFCLTLAGIPNPAIGQDCSVRVIRETIAKSHFFVLPAVIRIETTGIDPLNFFTGVDFDCEADGDGLFNSISTTGKLVPPNFGRTAKVIWQTAIIWPAILTGNAREESETCTVSVEGCDDTDDFELNILSLTIPLEEK
jgi:hypothetical protein